MAIGFFNFRERKEEQIRKASIDLASIVVLLATGLRNIKPKYMGSSNLTIIDTAVFGSFLLRSIVVSHGKKSNIYYFDQFYFKTLSNAIRKEIECDINIDELIDSRTLFYEREFMKAGTVASMAEAFQKVIENDYYSGKYEHIDEKSPIILTDLFESMECSEEISTYMEVLVKTTREYVISAKKSVS